MPPPLVPALLRARVAGDGGVGDGRGVEPGAGRLQLDAAAVAGWPTLPAMVLLCDGQRGAAGEDAAAVAAGWSCAGSGCW